MPHFLLSRFAVALGLGFFALATAEGRPNLLLVTVDDMSADSLGSFGCELEGTSPHIDQLAAEGYKFRKAHVQVGNCFPSRNVMWSGRYPHNSGVEGFYQVKPIDFPVLCDLMKEAGYYTAIRGKVSHSTPYQPYAWDADHSILPDGTKAHVKDAESYYTSTKAAIAAAEKAGKPFCFNINISDPHKPFWKPGDEHATSRVFMAEEVPVPKFLPDDPAIREELALYYSSVRRADDCFGAIMRALEESGLEEETFVMFLSDHGMPLPFAKTQLYHHSTHTPLLVKWPGVTEAGAEDDTHLVSAVDFLPTLLDVAGIEHPDGMDGRSFEPLLRGETQKGRDLVYKVYNENSGGTRNPMRGIQTSTFLYLFNPWSDGERVMATATNGTASWKRMKELADEDSAIAERVDLMAHRVVEEFYDIENDPDCLRNLAAEPAYEKELARHRRLMRKVMTDTGDHLLEAFERRGSRSALDDYMTRVEAEALERRADRRKNKGRKNNRTKDVDGGKKQSSLIEFDLPELVIAGAPVTVKVPHQLPDDLGEQSIHVTLKAGPENKRVGREVVKATGKGVLEVRFEVPAEVPGRVVSFAAFVGEEYQGSLQHISTKAIEVGPAE